MRLPLATWMRCHGFRRRRCKEAKPALNALALLADRDGADTLTRVWMTDSLSALLRVKAARLMAEDP